MATSTARTAGLERVAPDEGGASTGCGAGAAAAGAGPTRRWRRAAVPPATAFSATPIHRVACTPTLGMKKKPVIAVPATAPQVLRE